MWRFFIGADCILKTINKPHLELKALETNCDAYLKAANRNKSDDNFLYCPSSKDVLDNDDLIHFRQHWTKGEPIIVRDVLKQTSGLSWEPMVMCRALRGHLNSDHSSKGSKVNTVHCLSGCQVWNHGHLNNVLENPFLFLPDVHTKCEISNHVRKLPWTLFLPKTYKNASE